MHELLTAKSLLLDLEIRPDSLATAFDFHAPPFGIKSAPLSETKIDTSNYHWTPISNDLEFGGIQTGELMFSTHKVVEPIALFRERSAPQSLRISLSNAAAHYSANAVICVVWLVDRFYVFDVSDAELIRTRNDVGSPLYNFFARYQKAHDTPANVLLQKLLSVGGLPWKTVRPGPSGIGHTLASILNLEVGASRLSNFHGITITSTRSKHSKGRLNLFAQVPTWAKSRCRSSKEILDRYGYDTNAGRRLNVTVTAETPNAQGLYLRIDDNLELLIESAFVRQPDGALVSEDVVAWDLSILKKRLTEKHGETFWVDAVSTGKGVEETFIYQQVTHTNAPDPRQFVELLKGGVVSVDHIIAESRTGGATEKGPLFKIDSARFSELFPPSRIYDITLQNRRTRNTP